MTWVGTASRVAAVAGGGLAATLGGVAARYRWHQTRIERSWLTDIARLAVGRVLLLTSGVVTIVAGLLLLILGTLQAPPEFRWSAGPAVTGTAVVTVFVAAGLLMCATALFGDLPGASIAERMMVEAELDMAAPRRELTLLLTAALVVAWIAAMATLLRTHSAQAFDVMQFLMPVLAGALAGVWRAGKPNRLASLGMAAAAGAASSCLFLAAMILGEYYQFDPLGYLFWWGLTGAVFGAVGYGMWLVGRRPRHWRARSAHAH